MKIHEYQAKQILREFGVKVPEGVVCSNPKESAAAFTQLGMPISVVKAQIHAGGRGKGGGVRLVKSSQEAADATSGMMSSNLITHQTGPEGQPVTRVLVEVGSQIADELYIGIAMDRTVQRPVMMASAEGGVEIEEVAQRTPDKILKETIDPDSGLRGYQARRLVNGIGIPRELANEGVKLLQALSRAFVANDCSLAEINPLVVTEEGGLLALDAKMNFDDNALFRHEAISAMRDLAEEDPAELEADEAGFSYVTLDGNIGCLVNGAGLAMATMDIIKHHGSSPANFLDVGGSASAEQVAHAFRIILGDENVRGILVNIFGGILKCSTLAEGIVAAFKELDREVPLVVRLEGTEVEEGRAILESSGLAITTAADMGTAAEKIVALVS